MKKNRIIMISSLVLSLVLISCGPEIIVGDRGDKGEQGEKGDAGVSIISVNKTDTTDNIDTYTITFSDGRKSFFKVRNGTDGKQGIEGIPGADGHTPVIKINKEGNWEIDGIDSGVKATGPKGDKGEPGKDGNSIVSISKLKEEGLEVTYIITYSNGETYQFIVRNGKDGVNGQDGAQGEQGIQGIPGKDGHTPVITIGENGNWFIDGTDSECKATGPKGDKGEAGRGIISIDFASKKDNIDTYIITYSDGSTEKFTIINGKNGADGAQGEQGIQGIQGLPGKDGHTPVITIGNNGNWYVDGVDTTIKATGPKGDKGDTGAPGKDGSTIISIKKSKTEGNKDTYIITFSDGYTSEFIVTNGIQGEKGDQGIQGIQGEPGKDGKIPTITVNENNEWIIDGVNTHINSKGEKGDKGETGQDGRSIVSIALKESKDNIDTYIVTYSDGNTDMFVVKNGKDGAQGIQGVQGVPGKDGVTPTITINENNEWVINGVNSGVLAIGQRGETGASAYEIYIKYHPEYQGTEEQWIDDLANGRLQTSSPEAICEVEFYYEFNLVETQKVKKGSYIAPPKFTIDEPGYHVSNWGINNYEDSAWIFDLYTCSYDHLALYAHKEENIYKINLSTPLGILERDYVEVRYMQSYVKLPQPNHNNYSINFDGWYKADDGTQLTNSWGGLIIEYKFLTDINAVAKFQYSSTPELTTFELKNKAALDSTDPAHTPIHVGDVTKLELNVDENNLADELVTSGYLGVSFSNQDIVSFDKYKGFTALAVGTTEVTVTCGSMLFTFTYTVEDTAPIA